MNRYESGSEENRELPQEVIETKIPEYLEEIRDSFLTVPRVPFAFMIGSADLSNQKHFEFTIKGLDYSVQRHETLSYVDFALTIFPQKGVTNLKGIEFEGVVFRYKRSTESGLESFIKYRIKTSRGEELSLNNTPFALEKVRGLIDSLPKT